MTCWDKLRLEVLQRDNYTCKECGQSLKQLDVHHKIPKRKGGLDILDNLIALCRSCHKITEYRQRIITTITKTDKELTTTITIRKSIKKELASFGTADQSYEDIIVKLMEYWKGGHSSKK